MEGAIQKLLEWINAILLMIGGENKLMSAFSDQNDSLYTFANNVLTTVCLPIAHTILALFVLLEIHRMTLKMDGMSGSPTMSIEMICKLFVRMSVFKLLIDNADVAMTAIYDFSLKISSGVLGLLSAPAELEELDIVAIMTEPFEFWFAIMALILCLIILLVVIVAYLISILVIVGRMIELYMYFAISPIPLATLPHDEFSQIGKGFLKTFAAKCLQGTFMIIIIGFSNELFMNVINPELAEEQITTLGFLLPMLGLLGYSVLLIIALTSTGKWAKAICNAA